MSGCYRRAPHLVCYWRRRQFIVENYARHRRVSVAPIACEVLDFFDRWRPLSAIVRRFHDVSTEQLSKAVADLVDAGLLEFGSASGHVDDALASWDDWSPAAAFFHFATKDAHGVMDPTATMRRLRRRARRNPPPASTKEYPARPRLALPTPAATGELERALLERRTWRAFSRRPIELGHLSTILGLAFGVQSWLEMRGIGRFPLKTSPSGGARHPIEAYVVAIRVRGVRRGLYHYNAARHCLERLETRTSARRFVGYLNGQKWFGGASVGVLLTAVFPRTQWKYRAPRAYRAVLIEAGHACQTFCLVATRLGLAPFCTMALADSRIEADLELDGITESVLYAAGVGTRP